MRHRDFEKIYEMFTRHFGEAIGKYRYGNWLAKRGLNESLPYSPSNKDFFTDVLEFAIITRDIVKWDGVSIVETAENLKVPISAIDEAINAFAKAGFEVRMTVDQINQLLNATQKQCKVKVK